MLSWMSDPRDPGASATPYRQASPHARASVVLYSPGGPASPAIASIMDVIGVFICGCAAVTQWSSRDRAVLALVGASFVVAAVALAMWRVAIEVDHGAGTLLLRKTRWPLRSRVRTFPLVRVWDAEVRREPPGVGEDDGEGIRYMVFLVIDGDAAVPLVERMWGTEERHEKTAAAIRALLLPRAPLA